MKNLASPLSSQKYSKINIGRMKKNTSLFICLFISLPLIMGFTFPESNRGWNSATLEISASRLDNLLKRNKNTYSTNMELYGSNFQLIKNVGLDNCSESLDDEYHINRYLGIPRHNGIRIPTETKEKLLKEPGRKIRTYDFEYTFDDFKGVPKFTFFQVMKKSLPGSVFNLPEVEEVVFWQHRLYFGEKVFMVEFVIKDKEIFESLEEYMLDKYGDEWKDDYGGRKIVNNVDSWKYGSTSIRLVRTKMSSEGLAFTNTYSLAFLDIERTEGVINYLYALMKLAPDIGINLQSSSTGTTEKSGKN